MNKFKYLRSLLLAAMFGACLAALPAAAQEGNGTISGTVKDSSGAALKGALVQLEPSDKRAASDDQGQFKITDVAAGQYTLTASYVGLANFTETLTVGAGRSSSVDAVLNVAGVTDQVVVTADRIQGEAEAINIERTADDIVQVLPLKVIQSLPNTNIADAVGRLPSVTLERDEGEGKYVQIRGTEPRLSNMTINGVNIPSPESGVRNIKMDIIPAALVDRIEVSKTLSANQDADAIGGSVNLVTKAAGDKPSISFGGIGGYTPIQSGRWLDSFDGSIGKRFGKSKNLGLMFGGSYDWNGRGIDDIEPGQTTGNLPNGTAVALVDGMDTREYEYYRTRYGFETGLDYRLGAGSTAYVKGLYSDFHDFGDVWVYSYNRPDTPLTQSGGITTFDYINGNPGSMAYREYIRRPDQQIWSFSAGARHDLSSTLILYDVSVSRSHQYGGFPTTRFNNGPSNVQFNIDTTDPLRPKFIVENNAPIFDPTQYSMSQQQNIDERTAELSVQGSFSVAQRYNAGSHLGTFEAGFKFRNSDKMNLVNDPYCNPPTPNILLSQVLGTYSNANYYDNSYQLGPLSSYDKITSLFNCSANSPTFDGPNSHLNNDGADYSGTERVVAGYLMNTISIGKSRLQAGVRFEATNESYNANQVNTDASGNYVSTVPVTGGGSYLNVLPSVHWQYILTPNTNIRATYGMAISRPNFSDLVPSVLFSPNGSPPTAAIGNPSLKATLANDFDVLFEHFFQPLGILQAGFFYKDLTDPIYNTTQTNSPLPQYAGFTVQQSINGPRAHITGFEAAWEQRLSFLPGLMNGFGVAANYSYMTSQVSFPADFSGGRTDHPALLRQAPNTWNLGFTYDKARFSMRFGVSHNDANIDAYNYQVSDPTKVNDPILGLKGPTGDIYFYAHTQFDVQGSYRMHKGLRLVVSGLNLSNEVFGFYQGSPIYPIQREFYKSSVMIGMRWSSGAEQ
ncbi:MAG: TonB-dependent receptor [Acidobacteriia bacterium]|nr:TonB-dependent receptor [Terriglobia bacterium]